MTVIGTAATCGIATSKRPPAIKVPIRQMPFPARFLVVRTGVDYAPVLSLTQRKLRDIDPTER